MLQTFFKATNSQQPLIREFDPTTLQRMKEGAYVIKLISEAEVSVRKCRFYAGLAVDQNISDFFTHEAEVTNKYARVLQQYYESMTQE